MITTCSLGINIDTVVTDTHQPFKDYILNSTNIQKLFRIVFD